MCKENLPQLMEKIDLNLNFLPMQMKVHFESRKHRGQFMIIGICRCLASGEPLKFGINISPGTKLYFISLQSFYDEIENTDL